MTYDELASLLLPFVPLVPHRGVFRAVAPIGRIAVQSIDSSGNEYMSLEMPSREFNSEVVTVMWELLDVGDPVMVIRLLRED